MIAIVILQSWIKNERLTIHSDVAGLPRFGRGSPVLPARRNSKNLIKKICFNSWQGLRESPPFASPMAGYGVVVLWTKPLAGVEGIEPSLPVLETGGLPLTYTPFNY